VSWGFGFTGTKESVKASVVEYCDKAAISYQGKPEADDVICTKDRVCALVDALVLGDGNLGVKATGCGSHSSTQDGPIHAQAQFAVSRCVLPDSGS